MTEQEVEEWWSLSRDENNLLVGVTMFAVQARRL